MRIRLFLLVSLTLLATPLAGQVVRGRLSDSSGAPVGGAIVTLVAADRTIASRGLSSATGNYSLRAPRAGEYTVSVMRIGYPPFRSAVLRVGDLETITFSTALPDDPIVLADLDVSSGAAGACRIDTVMGSTTATLLEEVRKALDVVDLALRDRGLRFEVQRYVRRVDKNSVEQEKREGTERIASWPVQSLPATLLAERGFVQRWDSVESRYLPFGVTSGRVWFGPEPTTLFSDAFLSTHCYRVVTERASPGKVGLRFSPIRGRRLPEIAGTLWLDRRTLGLESLEYSYVNLPRHYSMARNGMAGGTMGFARLPNGIWIVAKWDLRAPIEETENDIPVGIGGYLEEGGKILRIRTTAGDSIY
jgi:hypothetical protein